MKIRFRKEIYIKNEKTYVLFKYYKSFGFDKKNVKKLDIFEVKQLLILPDGKVKIIGKYGNCQIITDGKILVSEEKNEYDG